MKFGMGYAYWGTTWKADLNYYAKVAKKLAGMGFEVMEVSADHIYNMSDNELRELNAIGKEYGMILLANSGPAKKYDLSSSDRKIRQQGLEYFSTIVRKMSKINSPILAGAIYSHWPSDFCETNKKAAWDRSIPLLKELGNIAETLGINCALEVLNRNETYILTCCEEALAYCNEIGKKNITLLLDTYHMNIEEDNMCDAIRLANNQLGHFHVGEANRKLPGMNNTINWGEVGQALRDIHYEGTVVMEPFLKCGGEVGRDIRVWRDLSNGADEGTLDMYLKQSLDFLKSKFKNKQ